MRTLLLTILLIASAALCAADFNLDSIERLELKGFQTNGVTLRTDDDRTEEIAWRIQGDSALIQMPNYRLNGFRMNIEGQQDGVGSYHLESPSCIYNHDLQEVRGDGAVLLSGPAGFSISGIGYDFYLNAAENALQLVIRDAVHITFDLDTSQDWRETGKREKLNFKQ